MKNTLISGSKLYHRIRFFKFKNTAMQEKRNDCFNLNVNSVLVQTDSVTFNRLLI